ncbi:MAG: helix-turn-helix domain-containing protein [Candidatus Aquilonibacter sp.]
MSTDEPSSFGALLRQFRLAKGLSQESLAGRARISTEAIGALERGNRTSPQRTTLSLLIDALELDHGGRLQLEAAAVKPPLPRKRALRGSLPEPPPPAERSNLPHSLTRFVGRSAEMVLLLELIREHKLVTITGVGGVGKTRMAIELGLHLLDQFPDGIWLIELAALRDASLLPQAISAVLNISEIPGRPLLDSIASALRSKALLLIVDNCEHVIDGAARAIEQLVRSCHGLTVVATSREPLRVGEAVFRMPILRYPAGGAVKNAAEASEFAAVELFLQGARAASPGFTLTDRNVAAISSICRQLDGIPLAIELAAAKVAAFGVEQIAGNLRERFRLLRGGSRNALPRQQTLRALVDWSFDLLTVQEQDFLTALSVFSGGFTEEAAAFVCVDDSQDEVDVFYLLGSLIDKSLVVTDAYGERANRYSLLETIRIYAHDRLVEQARRDTICGRHASYMLAFARRTAASFESAHDDEWYDLVRTDIDNIRDALEWSLAQGHDIALGAELGAILGPYWESRSYGEGKRWLTAAHEVLDRLEPHVGARVLLEYVRALPFDEHAMALSEAAVRAYRDANDMPGLCHALEYRARALINIARYDDAARVLAESEHLSSDAEHHTGAARLEALHGFADVYAGKTESAHAHFVKAEALLPPPSPPRELALVMRGFAVVALMRSAPSLAVEYARRALHLVEDGGNVRIVGIARSVLAHSLLAAGRAAEACDFAREAIGALGGTQTSLIFSDAVIVLAAAYESLGRHEEVMRLLPFLHRLPLPPFRSDFLIEALQTDTLAKLEERMGHSAFADACASGSQIDELALVDELSHDRNARPQYTRHSH